MSERTRPTGTLETRGIEQVPERERTARVRGLFPTWAGANITVLLLTMGAVLVAHRLAFWQVLVVAVAAPAASFALVGVAGIAGRRGGAPGMALSRAVFGQRGNLLPGALIWTARWGWETINAVTGAYALLTVLDIGLGVRDGTALRVVALTCFVAATFAISGLGIRAVRACTAYAAVLFGLFSVLVLAYLLPTTDWSPVLGRPAGPAAAMLTGFGVIAAGGISWLPSAPDFTRYLPGAASGGAIVAVTVAGACVVAAPLILLGAVLAVGTPDLAAAHDPVSFLGESLPTWIAVPYLLIALTGSLLINALSMYSAGFTAQTLGFRVSRLSAVLVNAVISLVLGTVLMLTARAFVAEFTAFLSLLAVTFSAWGGVFGADMLRRPGYDGAALSDTGPGSAYWYRHGFCPAAVTAWAAGLGTGLLFLRSVWFDGPLARDTFVGEYGLGWIVTIAVSGLLYLALPKPAVVAAAADRG
ncbi:cytosine permease [Streptomyces sp. NPDC008150]|uniref:purine-cytosine permease family protein n=1 Tax=Streptomyces sp. NPDC008150 TaxID=3364816 RepID=UPI0036E41006